MLCVCRADVEFFFFFQAEDGIRDYKVTGVQTCALPICAARIAYDEILRTTRERGYPHLIRVWNYLRDINAGEGEAERYKRFCAGRHDEIGRASCRERV